MYKILTGKENIDYTRFFTLAPVVLFEQVVTTQESIKLETSGELCSCHGYFFSPAAHSV